MLSLGSQKLLNMAINVPLLGYVHWESILKTYPSHHLLHLGLSRHLQEEEEEVVVVVREDIDLLLLREINYVPKIKLDNRIVLILITVVQMVHPLLARKRDAQGEVLFQVSWASPRRKDHLCLQAEPPDKAERKQMEIALSVRSRRTTGRRPSLSRMLFSPYLSFCASPIIDNANLHSFGNQQVHLYPFKPT